MSIKRQDSNKNSELSTLDAAKQRPKAAEQ
jgi:hypothetical protein